MRVLIIEDEIIIARFIESQIKNYYAFETTVALSIEEAESAIATFKPHLILCDIELNDQLDGIELMFKLKKEYAFELIFITSYQSKATINRAFALKPANYIIKPLDEGRLYAGTLPIVTQLLEKRTLKDGTHLHTRLSPTELSVLKLIAQKRTTKEIAAQLYLSPHTIKNYRHRICRKLNLEEENNALLTWSLEHYEVICHGDTPEQKSNE